MQKKPSDVAPESLEVEGESLGGEEKGNGGLIPWTVAILAILFGSCTFWTGGLFMMLFALDETLGDRWYITAGTGLSAGIISVATFTYGTTLIRRIRWKGPGEYKIFTGIRGWINAITGLGLTALIFLIFLGLFVVMVVEQSFEDLGILLGTVGFLGPLFGMVGRNCWRGLQELRAERGKR